MPSHDPAVILSGALFVDIECAEDGRIRELGWVKGEAEYRWRGKREIEDGLRLIEDAATGASFVGGHNIIAHDLPILGKAYGELGLHRLPIIDSLYLSPLAFPIKPYHRLLKNDKIIRQSESDPVSDSVASRLIIGEAISAFRDGGVNMHRRWQLVSRLLARAIEDSCFRRGLQLLDLLILQTDSGAVDVEGLFFGLYDGQYCPTALTTLLGDPATAGSPALAFIAAWLSAAGQNSIIPPWVEYNFPEARHIARQLRARHCGNANCEYCQTAHDPRAQLQHYFGFKDFRPQPALPGDPNISLQFEIVRRAMAGDSLLTILPTGGGKSLCFQVPALYHYHRTGAMAIVLSPLQALMKDQVEGLGRKTSVNCVAALYGLLTPPERAEVLEEIAQGGIGILYVSPEQLRNPSFRKAVLSRSISCWVFDEAHCISKWGHDFRPDYLYAARFIREVAEEQRREIPQLLCMTATAKEDVKEEIRDHFQQAIDRKVDILDGGAERENLSYQIEMVSVFDISEKAARIHTILKQRLEGDDGSAVVFVATRKNAERCADILQQMGWSADFFHAGLDAESKTTVLNAFMSGKIRIICATNAFGMGIDKDDIRLVIHAQVPGSLENYLQEAGRAGRDRKPAECILLYNQADLEQQFQISSYSRITLQDIKSILRALHKVKRKQEDPTLWVTTGEIVDFTDGAVSFVNDAPPAIETKVATALALLERQEFIQRDQNQTRVFQGRALVSDLAAARRRISALDLSDSLQYIWLQFMEVFLTLRDHEANSLEPFTHLKCMKPIYDRLAEKEGHYFSRYQPMLRILNEMATPGTGLIEKDLLMSAFVTHGTNSSSDLRHKRLLQLERHLLDLLRENDPDASDDVVIDLARANTRLQDEHPGLKPDIDRIRRLLGLWSRDRPRIEDHSADFLMRSQGRITRATLPRGWQPLAEMIQLRHEISHKLMAFLVGKARVVGQGKQLISFSEKDMLRELDDLFSSTRLRHNTATIVQYLLVVLHEFGVITLQQGKALLTRAMSIQLHNESGSKRLNRTFTKADYQPLEVYYEEKNFQIHVMAEYAVKGADSLSAHLKLISNYFRMGKEEFAKIYFAGRTEHLQRATSMESYLQIVENLRNPVQQRIVSGPEEENALILAGPGSGKTRVVSHRCAYLLRVLRVRPESVLVVCFNREACLSLRQRIHSLAENEARRVAIHTYHGLALRLLGRSLADQIERAQPDINFDKLLTDATQMLQGPADDSEELEDHLRDRLLRGFQYILVDEYQDVGPLEYAFLSEIAGRSRQDPDRKLRILAVGDDDQSIYRFKHANVEYIRRFAEEYQAKTYHLVENYRSTQHIISAANSLIQQNHDRMKTDREIQIDRRRRHARPGGAWHDLDKLLAGRVQVVDATSPAYEAVAIVFEMERLRRLVPDLNWNEFAILGRWRRSLHFIRAVLEAKNIPVAWRVSTGKAFNPLRTREIICLLDKLAQANTTLWDDARLKEEIAAIETRYGHNTWTEILYRISEDLAMNADQQEPEGEPTDAASSSGGATHLPASYIRSFIIESLLSNRPDQHHQPGVNLMTVHGAKGLEFNHVFILGDDWKPNGPLDDREEERRTYYVAMTRARQNLILFRSPILRPWLAHLPPACMFSRTIEISERGAEYASNLRGTRYDLMNLDQLHLGYPSLFAADHPIHQRIEALRIGDCLNFNTSSEHLELTNADGHPVARLSRKGKSLWQHDPAREIQSIRIHAVVRRIADEAVDTTYAQPKVPTWHIPICEIMTRTKPNQHDRKELCEVQGRTTDEE